jgi:myo-inositol-1-phosphate synthase
MIRLAIVGLGNCASSLVQGIHYCREHGDDAVGVLLPELAGYVPGDIEVVAAFDIDRRKVGLPVAEAIFAAPNNTKRFQQTIPDNGVVVSAGPVLDGVSALMLNSEAARSFRPVDTPPATAADVTDTLRRANAEIVISFLPVGSQQASEFYARCALDARAAFVNAIPVFLASNPAWSRRFEAAGLPLLGDDFKAQVGATIVHRTLARLFKLRGAEIDRSYQLNVGGNTDFLNMMDMERLTSKRLSKTESVQSAVKRRLDDDKVRRSPISESRAGFSGASPPTLRCACRSRTHRMPRPSRSPPSAAPGSRSTAGSPAPSRTSAPSCSSIRRSRWMTRKGLKGSWPSPAPRRRRRNSTAVIRANDP